MKIQVKICGLTLERETDYLKENQVDYGGIVLFYPKSKRNVSLQTGKQIISHLDSLVKTVAVVVNPDIEQVKAIEDIGFSAIQIHGKLEQKVYQAISIPIFRAYNIEKEEVISIEDPMNKIEVLVLDNHIPGSGKTFDWSKANQFFRGKRKLMAAGGLHKGNVKEAIRCLQPDIVDVSSGVEGELGMGKDAEKIRQFVKQVKEA